MRRIPPPRSSRARRALGAVTATAVVLACDAGAFGRRHALVIGIDGLRSDALRAAAAPRLQRLAAEGTVAWDAVSGGYPGTPTEQPTVSGPGWATIVTGVWTDHHRLLGNNFAPYNAAVAARHPHFFRRIRESAPFASLSSLVEWAPIDAALVSPVGAFTTFRQTALDGDTRDLTDKAVAHLQGADPDVVFLHFDAIDYAGHGSGFSPSNPAYLEAIAEVDTGIGRVLDEVHQRTRRDGEEWLVLVTTDHGGLGTGHGGQSDGERTIFVIAHGPGVPAGAAPTVPAHSCIPATVAAYLGIPVGPEWLWDPTILGYVPPPEYPLPAPRVMASPPDTRVLAGMPCILRAAIAGSGLAFQWHHDDVPVPGATGPELRLEKAAPDDDGLYTLVAENRGGRVTAGPARLEVLDPAALDVEAGLLSLLPFDAGLQDASPAGNHGIVMGRPGIVAGHVGTGALGFTSRPDGTRSDHVRLPDAVTTALGTGDFSVAFWVRATEYTGDPPLFGNKDWRSGANTGFVVAAQPDGRFKMNLRGADGSRVDANGGPIRDGAWHHVAVTLRRGGDATMYRDGRPVASASLAGSPGTIASGLPWNIGQDGTGRYTDGGRAGITAGRMDEFALWGRALEPAEVAVVHARGVDGASVLGPPRLRMETGEGWVTLEWDDPAWRLQEASRGIPGWTDVPGGPRSPVTLPQEPGGTRFFRLAR